MSKSNKLVKEKPKLGFIKDLMKHKFLYMLTIPAIVIVFLVSYLPMFGVVLAFERYDFAAPVYGFFSKFVGLDNFKFIFSTPDAIYFTRNTLFYSSSFIIVNIVTGVIFAAIIVELNNRKIARFYQTLAYFPHFMSWIVISIMLYSFLNLDTGLITKALNFVGISGIDWYKEPRAWPPLIILMHIWKGLGGYSILYIATMTGIDTEMYEAAFIDGGGKVKQFLYITLPMLKPMIMILLIMGIGNLFKSDFALFNFLPRGGLLAESTLTLDVYVYRSLMSGSPTSFAQSSAAGLFQSVVGFILLVFANNVIKKISPERAMF